MLSGVVSLCFCSGTLNLVFLPCLNQSGVKYQNCIKKIKKPISNFVLFFVHKVARENAPVLTSDTRSKSVVVLAHSYVPL